ncbi:MAG: hypothetical protein FJ348_07395 [Sphingomonadales bacterium]|nr:hypothetical protein [Sphingomonadales bacterium]
MDRIDWLINTLKQQYQQKESPDVLLQTINQLQSALTAAGAGKTQHLGTAKIAVMMPVSGAAPVVLQQEPPLAKEQVITESLVDATPSINDRIVTPVPVLADRLRQEPIRELKKAIGINDRFLLLEELFGGDEKKFDQAIKTLDGFSILAEASFWIEKEIKAKPGYSKDSPAARLLDQLVSRRFS